MICGTTIGGRWTAVNELYNPATNTWGDAMPLIEARGAQGVAMVGGDIYLVGR